jgi:hypothetical protein
MKSCNNFFALTTANHEENLLQVTPKIRVFTFVMLFSQAPQARRKIEAFSAKIEACQKSVTHFEIVLSVT